MKSIESDLKDTERPGQGASESLLPEGHCGAAADPQHEDAQEQPPVRCPRDQRGDGAGGGDQKADDNPGDDQGRGLERLLLDLRPGNLATRGFLRGAARPPRGRTAAHEVTKGQENEREVSPFNSAAAGQSSSTPSVGLGVSPDSSARPDGERASSVVKRFALPRRVAVKPSASMPASILVSQGSQCSLLTLPQTL